MIAFPWKCTAAFSMFVALASEQDSNATCPGICLTEGESMLNAATDVKIDDKTATCGYFNNEIIVAQVPNDESCVENAVQAANAGCKCGIPVDCPGICTSSFAQKDFRGDGVLP